MIVKVTDIFSQFRGSHLHFNNLSLFRISIDQICLVGLLFLFNFGIELQCFAQSNVISGDKVNNEALETDLGDLKYVFATNVTDFVSKLNQLGEQGYKIEQITKLPLNVNEKFGEMKLAGIVNLDRGHTYEYDWFEGFVPGEIVTRINSRAKNGFYFRDRLSVTQGFCEDNSTYRTEKSDTGRIFDSFVSSLQYSVGSIFFLERRDRLVKSIEYRVEIGLITSRDRHPDELAASIESLGSLGFRPLSMSVSKVGNKNAFIILAERDKSVTNNADFQYRLIAGEFGFEKKITAATVDGFKVLFAGRTGAVRYALLKSEIANSGISIHDFLKTYTKSFQSDLAKLSTQKNLEYLSLMDEDWTCDSVEAVLIFHKRVTEKSEMVQFESVKIMDELKKSTKQNPTAKLMPPAPEVIRKIERLLKEGFVFRDLFFSDGINLLLEKRIK
jgi:hypothetical protein